MKNPSNVVLFAGGENNMEPYVMFRDYWNHYRASLGAKNVTFSEVDKDGKPITLEEKEVLMNAALKREIARVSGVNFADFSLERYITNPMVNWATFAIVSSMIDMILPESIIETTGLYTDVRVIPWGDSTAFEVKPRDIFVVSKAGRGKRTSEVKKQYNGQVVILPEMREISTQVSLYKVLSGAESLADFTAKIVRSMETQLTVDCYNAFATAMANLPSTTTTGLQVSGYSQASLVRLCQQVGAWNQGAKPIVVGTQLALVNVLPDDVNYRYTLSDEFMTLGYVKTAFGYDVLCLPQVADITTPFGTVLSNSYLWIVSPSSQKILKLVLEGSTLTNTNEPFDNANLTQATTIFKSWGVGVATNAVAGVITL